MAHGSRWVVLGWLAVTGLLGGAIVAPAVLATPPAPEHKVTICHRTNSNPNPYLIITVDIASAGHLHGGHDTQHLGPIWEATLKGRHIEWGDIIPPYSYGAFSYPGSNWTAQGQAIWANECRIPSASPTPPATPPATPSPATPSPAASASPNPSATPSSVASSSPAGSVEGVTGTPNGEYEGIAGTPPPTDSPTATEAPSGRGVHLLELTLAGLIAAALLVTPRRVPGTVVTARTANARGRAVGSGPG